MARKFYRQIGSQPGVQLNRLVPVMGTDGSGGGGGGTTPPSDAITFYLWTSAGFSAQSPAANQEAEISGVFTLPRAPNYSGNGFGASPIDLSWDPSYDTESGTSSIATTTGPDGDSIVTGSLTDANGADYGTAISIPSIPEALQVPNFNSARYIEMKVRVDGSTNADAGTGSNHGVQGYFNTYTLPSFNGGQISFGMDGDFGGGELRYYLQFSNADLSINTDVIVLSQVPRDPPGEMTVGVYLAPDGRAKIFVACDVMTGWLTAWDPAATVSPNFADGVWIDKWILLDDEPIPPPTIDDYVFNDQGPDSGGSLSADRLTLSPVAGSTNATSRAGAGGNLTDVYYLEMPYKTSSHDDQQLVFNLQKDSGNFNARVWDASGVGGANGTWNAPLLADTGDDYTFSLPGGIVPNQEVVLGLVIDNANLRMKYGLSGGGIMNWFAYTHGHGQSDSLNLVPNVGDASWIPFSSVAGDLQSVIEVSINAINPLDLTSSVSIRAYSDDQQFRPAGYSAPFSGSAS